MPKEFRKIANTSPTRTTSHPQHPAQHFNGTTHTGEGVSKFKFDTSSF